MPGDDATASGDARPEEDLATVAARHAYLYGMAASIQVDRILTPTGAWDEAESDALLLVLALRNLVRAAEMAKQHLPRPLARKVKEDLANFHAELPGLVQARDVLDHFDDYARGKGKRQKTGDLPVSPPDFGMRVTSPDLRFVGFQVGPYVIDLAKARSAAHTLGSAVLMAATVHHEAEIAEAEGS